MPYSLPPSDGRHLDVDRNHSCSNEKQRQYRIKKKKNKLKSSFSDYIANIYKTREYDLQGQRRTLLMFFSLLFFASLPKSTKTVEPWGKGCIVVCRSLCCLSKIVAKQSWGWRRKTICQSIALYMYVVYILPSKAKLPFPARNGKRVQNDGSHGNIVYAFGCTV